jgi:hypothetical protein
MEQYLNTVGKAKGSTKYHKAKIKGINTLVEGKPPYLSENYKLPFKDSMNCGCH